MTDLSALLDQWDALANGATEGPWDYAGQGWVRHGDFTIGSDQFPEVLAAHAYNDQDAAFIAAARTGWPQAAAAIRAVLGLIEIEPGVFIHDTKRIAAGDIRRALTDALTNGAHDGE